MNVVLAKTETGPALSDSFAIAHGRLPGTDNGRRLRRQAFDAYERAGLPHRRIEDWKYTDLRVLMREVLPLAAAPDAAALKRAAAALEAARDRRRAPAGAGRRRVRAKPVGYEPVSNRASASGRCARCWKPASRAGAILAPDNSNPMVALNSAMMTDGLVIEVADGAALTQPLHIVHIASGAVPAAMFTRSLLTARQGRNGDAGGKLYRRRRRENLSGPRFAGAAIGDGARLDHVRLVEDGREAFNISSAVVTLGAKAHFNTFRHDQRRACQPLSGR